MTVKNFSMATIENIKKMIGEIVENNNITVDVSNLVQDIHSFAMNSHNNPIAEQYSGLKVLIKNYYDAIDLVEKYVSATNPAFNQFFAVAFMTAHEYLTTSIPNNAYSFECLTNLYNFALRTVGHRSNRIYIVQACNFELRRYFRDRPCG